MTRYFLPLILILFLGQKAVAQCPHNKAKLDELYYNKTLGIDEKKVLLNGVIDCCETYLPNKTAKEKDRCAYAYQRLGDLYLSIGELDKGKEYLEIAVSLYADPARKERAESDLIFYYINKGLWKVVIEKYQAILRRGDLGKRLPMALNLVDAYLEEGRLSDAELLWNNIQQHEHLLAYQGYDYHELKGRIEHAKGNMSAARAAWERAIATAEELHSNESSQYAKMWLSMGENHFLPQRKYTEAQAAFQQVLAAYIPGYRPGKNNLPNSAQVGFIDDDIMITLQLIARSYYEQSIHDTQANSSNLLELALDCFDLIVDAETSLRQFYETSSANDQMITQRHNTMELALEICYELYQRSKDEKYIRAALHFSELVKDILLKEHIKEVETEERNLLPDDLLAERQYIMKKLASLLINEDDLTSHALTQRKEDFSTRKAEYLRRLQEEHPGYFRFKHSYFGASVDSIRSEVLASDQALIEYFIGQEKSYAIVITQREASFVEIPLVSEDEKIIKKYISCIVGEKNGNNRNRSEYQEKAKHLYHELISPIENSIRLPQRLLIIPDGYLANLPFEALLVTDQQQTYPLIQKHIVSMAFSAGVLLSQKNQPSEELRPYLGMAPVKFAEEGDMTYSWREVAAAQQLLGGDTLTYDNATKTNFLEIASNYYILHLATHASADKYNYPHVSFAHGEHLSLPEIFNLRLKAGLVILSSCEGNDGDVVSGEGLMSLSRGFNYAGSFSLMASQWEVRQKALSELVTHYIQNLKVGMDKDLALGMAKREYLNNAEELFSDPYFWAGFMQIGDNTQLYPQQGSFVIRTYFEGQFPRWVIYVLLILLGLVGRKLAKNWI